MTNISRKRPDDLEAFLHTLDAPTLASVLLDLAQEHEGVQQRLIRLRLADRPDRLAAALRKTLTGWRRASKFLAYREAREFGLALEAWLGQIERELMPKDPAAALELVEAFIESDAAFFDRADDSDGAVGDAVRAGCRLWLEAAARCEAPSDQWPDRLARLVSADQYGAREELLRYADRLLDEATLRQLVASFEAKMRDTLDTHAADDRLPVDVFAASGALSLLSLALRDPDVHVRAVLAYSPQPTPNQKEAFVRAYLEYGRPGDALPWLDGSWHHMDDTRERLLAEALRGLDRRDESARIRQHVFERTLFVSDLHAWLDDLPVASQPAAVERARQLASDHDDPVISARLLLDIGDDEAAEAALVAEPARIRGQDYGTLVPLAQMLEERRLCVGATAVYRALLNAILARAYAPAYAHAARYWLRLQAMAAPGVSLAPLEPHAVFDDTVRKLHARKVRFWQCVKDEGEMRPAD